MPRLTRPLGQRTSDNEDGDLVELIGVAEGDYVDIQVSIRRFNGSTPTLRVNRVKEDGKLTRLGALKSPEEVTNLLPLLTKGAERLRAVLDSASS